MFLHFELCLRNEIKSFRIDYKIDPIYFALSKTIIWTAMTLKCENVGHTIPACHFLQIYGCLKLGLKVSVTPLQMWYSSICHLFMAQKVKTVYTNVWSWLSFFELTSTRFGWAQADFDSSRHCLGESRRWLNEPMSTQGKKWFSNVFY